MSAIAKSENDITHSLSNWVLRATCLLMLLVVLVVSGATIQGNAQGIVLGGEATKLRALADKLVLMSKGLTSSQSELELGFAEEFVPLAEFVIRQLDRKK